MPEVTIKGIPEKTIENVSADLYAGLAEAVGCPADWFVIDTIPATYFTQEGKIGERPALVNVSWFPRPVEACEKAAKAIHEVFQKAGVKKLMVQFTEMSKDRYFTFDE